MATVSAMLCKQIDHNTGLTLGYNECLYMEILLIRINRKKKKIDKRDYCLKLSSAIKMFWLCMFPFKSSKSCGHLLKLSKYLIQRLLSLSCRHCEDLGPEQNILRWSLCTLGNSFSLVYSSCLSCLAR